MKIPSSLLAVVVLCLAGVARAAPVVTVEGFIGRGPEPENGTFTATVEATSDDGDVLVALSIPSLIVTDGTFSIDLDLADAVPTLTDGGVVSIGVDLGDGLEAVVLQFPVEAAHSFVEQGAAAAMRNSLR